MCRATLAGLLLFCPTGCYVSHERIERLDAGMDAGPRPLDAGMDAGPTPLDTGAGCGTRPTGDTRWPQYRLPGTPGGLPRSYRLVGTETVMDCVTGLEWQRTVDAMERTQVAAISYCDALTLAGHDDWRLPSTIELMTLVDYAIASPGPMIDATFFPGTPEAYFWTASPVVAAPPYGWYLNFGHGEAYFDGVMDTFCCARCVR